ncbi:MAG: hypothetical protein R3281_00135 [Balneolaceae bacterium]|nr:hypothetical protein [Balneolaceae bacterium]
MTPEFHAACSPSLSYDNKQIVFSGRKTPDNPWQIWMMNRDGSGKKKVTDIAENALTPAFLPNGKIVFSRETPAPGSGMGYSLFTVRVDGTDLNRITFHPHQDLYASVLHDGRIAMISRQMYPEKKDPAFMVLRPDGTKAQTFYHNKAEEQVKSIIRVTPDRRLVFVKRDETRDRVVSMSYADPGKPVDQIAYFPENGIQSVDLLNDDRLVVSSRESQDGIFSLRSLNFEGKTDQIYMDPQYHSIEPVAVRHKEVPPKLPSSVTSEKGTGIVFSQNVERSQVQLPGNPETAYVRVIGIERTLQEAAVKEDGSFYLKVESDMPIRLLSLDDNKEVLRGPSAWIWLRNGERRGCIGCHASKSVTPDNIAPNAIKHPPVMVTDTSRVIDSAYVQSVRKVLNENGGSYFEN